MISKAEIIVKTIGSESLYVLEKSRMVIYKENHTDIDFAKSLLRNYKERLENLEKEVVKDQLIDHTYLEYEFKTVYYAIDKLLNLLGNIKSENDKLEAMIFQSHIRRQDELLRSVVEESL